MFSRYYQGELAYLRELGRVFAQANPNIAGLLAERGSDPDVERLLEGFSFLSARIHERIEDAAPEIVGGLTELLLPHFNRTFPAASIVEFTPAVAGLRGRLKLPRGTEVGTRPVSGTSCRFRTTSDVEVLPASVTDINLDRMASATPVLRVSLSTTEAGIPLVTQPAGLRFFINGELPMATMVLLWMARHCESVEVRDARGTAIATLGADALRFPGFAADNAMVPWPKFGPDGYRLVQEYLNFPWKFLFFDVVGLDAAAALETDKFELAFQFREPPELPSRAGRDLLRLHCAPVVNLFDTTADPLRRDLGVYEHMLRATDLPPGHAEIYAVTSVIGIRADGAQRRTYYPFVEFRHVDPENRTDRPAYYRLRRGVSPIGDGIDTYLSVLTPRDVQIDLREETLSLDVTCTNRNLAGQLRAGDISMPTPQSPTTVKFKNIAQVTAPILPPLGDEAYWRMLAHMAIGHRPLTSEGALPALLHLYNFPAAAEHQAGRANQRRIDAITRVHARSIKRLLEGSPVRGCQMTIELDENGFASRGDAYLFGAVIDELAASHVTLNSFNELILRLQPSLVEYRWSPRNGNRPIL